MDAQLSARDAGDADAVRRLRRLHWGGMLCNAIQLCRDRGQHSLCQCHAGPVGTGDGPYCRNSLVSSPMPPIATVTVLTGSLHDADADRCSARDQVAGQQRHVVRDLLTRLLVR